MQAKSIPQGLSFCFAKLWKFSRRIHDWAVVLTQLHGVTTIAGVLDRCCVTGIGQSSGKLLESSDGCFTARTDVRHQLLGASLCKLRHPCPTLLLSDKAKGLYCKTVILLAQGSMSAGSQAEDLARAPTTTLGRWTIWSPFSAAHQPVSSQCRKRLAHCSRGERESLGQLGRGTRPLVEQTASHALCGLSGEFHNPIVA